VVDVDRGAGTCDDDADEDAGGDRAEHAGVAPIIAKCGEPSCGGRREEGVVGKEEKVGDVGHGEKV
jgi:hypothetical protein